jgi:hypothetical protein
VVGAPRGLHSTRVLGRCPRGILRLDALNLANAEKQSLEWIQAAIAILARGDLRRLEDNARLAGTDWRDVLVFSGLGQGDWGKSARRRAEDGRSAMAHERLFERAAAAGATSADDAAWAGAAQEAQTEMVGPPLRRSRNAS